MGLGYDGSYDRYPADWTDDRIVGHLREEAAKHGADALLVEDVGQPVSLNPGSSNYFRPTRARAICFLHLHPELAEKR